MVQGVSARRVKEITTELCGRKFSSSTVSRLTEDRLTEDLNEQVQAWAERELEQEYPFCLCREKPPAVRKLAEGSLSKEGSL